jgi:hypothetical protein
MQPYNIDTQLWREINAPALRFWRSKHKQELSYSKSKSIDVVTYVKACSSEANMLVQHYPTFMDATW